MKYLNNMKIGLRLNLVLSAVMIIIISSVGIYTISLQKEKIIDDTDLRMKEQVNDLSNIIEMELKKNQENIQRSLHIAQSLLMRDGGISEAKGVYSLKGKLLTENSDFVDEVTALTGASVSIFLKDQNGYVRVSTSLKSEDGKRATGTRMEAGSDVVKTIESNQVYSGRAKVLNSMFLTSYAPIIKDGAVIGLIGVGVPEKDLQSLKQIFQSKKYFESGYPFVVDKEGTFVIHPTNEGKNFANEEFFKQLTTGEGENKSRYVWEGKTKYQYFKYLPSIESFVSVSIYEAELFDIITQVRNTIVLSLLLGIGIFILVIRQISRSITRALQKSVTLARQIAEGDLNSTIELNQKDEIGELVLALNSMVLKLRNIVSEIITGANSIADASQQISSTSQQISQGASEQASSVEEVSSTMEEMVGNIEQNSDNARQTKTISTSALKGMEEVSERSGQAVEATRTISEKITIINDIAFQTNILALNAAVEAARAGEHGRGFAVVAAEVRKLAERSKLAADEIVGIAQKSLKLVEGSGEKVNEMLPEISKTTQLVQEIAASSLEQSNGSNQVNNALQQLNDITQENAAASEELATSAEELASQAEQLKEMIMYFKVDNLQINETRRLAAASKKIKVTKEKEILKPVYEKKIKPANNGIIVNLAKEEDGKYERF